MSKRHLERLKRKRLRHEKQNLTTPIDPITGEDIGPGAEQHHIAGRRYHDDTIPLMPKGHHMVTDAFRDMPSPIPGTPQEIEKIGRYLLGSVIVQDFILDRQWEHGERLIALARAKAAEEGKQKKSPGHETPPAKD
jgi:hypothetical protein